MQVQDLKYSRPMAQAFLSGASHEELKWAVNYIISLLEIPETINQQEKKYSLLEAKAILASRKLNNREVPSDFNGMRDEANPKYM